MEDKVKQIQQMINGNKNALIIVKLKLLRYKQKHNINLPSPKLK